MQLTITSEQRLYRAPDGSIRTDIAAASYEFWSRYRQVFDSVLVLARVANQSVPRTSPVEGPGVRVYPLSDYLGPTQFLVSRKILRTEVANACATGDALIARVPGAVGDLAIREYRRNQRPFGVYVVADPVEVLKRGVVDHPLRPFLRWYSARILRRWCRESSAVAYVTKQYLQGRYPPASQFTADFSDVDLPAEAFGEPRLFRSPPVPLRLVCVATLSQRYKGIDVLMDAIAVLVRTGLSCHFELVGDGRQRTELERKAEALDIRDAVTFVGQLPDARSIGVHLDSADLFVLPSLTEGLPRALIEAMARGLPCVASSVGGVTELLPHSDLVPPGEPQELARKILEMAGDPDRLSETSARNIKTAFAYRTEATEHRRGEFCSHVLGSAVTRSGAAIEGTPVEVGTKEPR
jgi:phosphatidyl-myo-inositol dimannoside synthase